MSQLTWRHSWRSACKRGGIYRLSLAGSADGAPLVENVDKRRSAFFRTVLARDSSLLNPFFSLVSLGTAAPSCAVELIAAAVVVG